MLPKTEVIPGTSEEGVERGREEADSRRMLKGWPWLWATSAWPWGPWGPVGHGGRSPVRGGPPAGLG